MKIIRNISNLEKKLPEYWKKYGHNYNYTPLLFCMIWSGKPKKQSHENDRSNKRKIS